MSEQPGRYQRSSGALVGSMLVLLVVVVGFVVFRGLFRGDQDVTQPTVDYAGAARQARSEGLVTAAAPDPMPRGCGRPARGTRPGPTRPGTSGSSPPSRPTSRSRRRGRPPA